MRQAPGTDFVLGRHALIDLSECSPDIIRDCTLVRDILRQAAKVAKVTIVGSIDHYFQPEGYSAVLVLAESHLSIHTWPEYRYVSIDLYSCNLETNFQATAEFLAARFKGKLTGFVVLDRGCAHPATATCQNNHLVLELR